VYEAHLLRRTYREGGRVRNETLANLSRLPRETIELVRRSLRGEQFLPSAEAFEVEGSLPHGHVAAVLALARRLELSRLLDRAPSKQRERALAMICQRVLEPGSKLACARQLAQSTLAEELGVQGSDADDLYAALDWLGERQSRIEDRLARRHLREGELVLYDVSSSYFEGRTCPLAERGYARDRRRGSLQIVYRLLCDREGRPVAVEVFAGSLHDDKTVPAQLEKLRERFGLTKLVLKRRVEQGTLHGRAEIGLAVGAVANRYRVKKHFLLEIEDERFDYRRNQEPIAEEAALDGIYLLRTSAPAKQLSGADVVRSYKQLAEVERAFRTLKSIELEIRPINHRHEQRVRAHVFLCMLAYYLEWHLRRAWAELTFEDEQPPPARDPVAKAERSPEARRKARQKTTAAGEPGHSFRTLLRELALIARTTNRITGTEATFLKVAKASAIQRRALELVEIDPRRL
jgi:hypothetical protein